MSETFKEEIAKLNVALADARTSLNAALASIKVYREVLARTRQERDALTEAIVSLRHKTNQLSADFLALKKSTECEDSAKQDSAKQ